MGWFEQHGLTLALLVTVFTAWLDLRVKLAVIARDQEWMNAQLERWGFVSPKGGAHS